MPRMEGQYMAFPFGLRITVGNQAEKPASNGKSLSLLGRPGACPIAAEAPLFLPDWRSPWCENRPMIVLPGLISRHDKSPTATNSEGAPSSSQQLNSQCGQNAACPESSRRLA